MGESVELSLCLWKLDPEAMGVPWAVLLDGTEVKDVRKPELKFYLIADPSSVLLGQHSPVARFPFWMKDAVSSLQGGEGPGLLGALPAVDVGVAGPLSDHTVRSVA